METTKVGIREFRDNLSTHLLTSESPIAITRHGDTVGYYIPARHKLSDEDRAAMDEAARKVQDMMSSLGITEDEILEDFKRWKKNGRK